MIKTYIQTGPTYPGLGQVGSSIGQRWAVYFDPREQKAQSSHTHKKKIILFNRNLKAADKLQNQNQQHKNEQSMQNKKKLINSSHSLAHIIACLLHIQIKVTSHSKI